MYTLSATNSVFPSRRHQRLHPVARIVMLDDGSDAGLGLLLHFRMWGHAVFAVRTWRDGLAYSRALNPHLVLVNLDVAGPRGLDEMTQVLHAYGPKGLRILVLKDGLPYFVQESESAELRIAGVPALKTALRSLAMS